MYDDIIIINDNKGNKSEFIKIDMFEISKNIYFALLDINNKKDNIKNILLAKTNHNDKNNTELIIISNEKELSKTINLFLKQWGNEEEIEFVNFKYFC